MTQKTAKPEASMSAMDTIFHCRAVRDSAPHKIDQTVIRLLLDAAVHAPTAVTSIGIRYLSFLHKTDQAIRSSLFASATTATFWWVRAISSDNQTLSPGACLVRYCITTRAPCTNSLRRYEFPRLMPSSFCLPPVEYSRGTIPPGRQIFPSSKAGAIADRGN